jgi:LysM repeat protein
MITRHTSSSVVCALAFALVVAPAFLAHAQTAVDVSSNAAPSAPAAPAATPAPPLALPADTNAPAATAPTERPATYTIVSGDSLWAIGQKYGVSVSKLVKANNFKDKHVLLHPGQVIKIPPATSDKTTK